MNITQVEKNIKNLLHNFSEKTFIFDLLFAYGIPKSTITLLKKGNRNLSKHENQIILKKKLFFQEAIEKDLHEVINALRDEEATYRHDPRFIVVTDYKTILAIDTKTEETLDIVFDALDKHYDFFLPWSGMEKTHHKNENPADVKAAERMAKLYDEILKDNKFHTHADFHKLNIFLSRLLFCFFAEDTGIFHDGLFTNSISSHTQIDGSDLGEYLSEVFEVLNTDDNRRNGYPEYLNIFPYVNGGLFSTSYELPKFSLRSRKMIIESGELNWAEINPDIFGSMIQAVTHPDLRGGLGMHYTSVPNIMKVIEPLMLNNLREEFKKYRDNIKKLEHILVKLAHIRIFDPACGSGNFLIIAYKEIRKLEIEVFLRLQAINPQISIPYSWISLSQFYGIELDDFAREIAVLSLWLIEHQMNILFKETFGHTHPPLPLKEGGNIYCGNATRLNWEVVCPKDKHSILYIFGNPPYVGYSDRDAVQKKDMDYVFDEVGKVKRLDYIGCWFKKAADYIQGTNAKYAFVSTNSICQGEQVSLLWPYIFSKQQEILFAHTSFKWSNNAKLNAGVTCVIVGIQNRSDSDKFLFSESNKKIVKSINPYLIEGSPLFMEQRRTPISDFPEMALGSSAIDGGHLMLSVEERSHFLLSNPKSAQFIKPFVGGADVIDGNERYCIWIGDDQMDVALSIPEIKERIDLCREYRLSAGRDARKAADVPHRFYYRKYKDQEAIVFPMTSSERRKYIPVGISQKGVVISNGLFVIYSASPFIFGLISSLMHMVWTHAVSGRLRRDIRYSVNLTYNNFPFPPVSEIQKELITSLALNIISVREQYPDRTLSELYNPDKMPDNLIQAHLHLDNAVESCYRKKPFDSDEERLGYLFKYYEKMIGVQDV